MPASSNEFTYTHGGGATELYGIYLQFSLQAFVGHLTCARQTLCQGPGSKQEKDMVPQDAVLVGVVTHIV